MSSTQQPAINESSLGAPRASSTAAAEGRWGTILLLYALCVLGASSISQAVPVIRDIARIFHGDPGWVISLPSALGAIGALAAGWVVDRVGDKVILVAGCVLLIAGDLGVAAASSLQVLLLYRAVEGIGYVCVAVSTVTMVARLTRDKRRTIALTLWTSFVPMSFAIPLILAAAVAGEHWRWAFWGHALLVLLCALAALTLPREQRNPAGASRMAGIGAVLRSPRPYALDLAIACAAFVQTGVVSTLPQFLTQRYGMSFGLASSIGTLGMLCNVAGCLSMGPLLNRAVPLMRLALVSVGVALISALALALAPLPLWVAVATALVFFFGSGLVVGFWALLPQVAPTPAARGATSGLVTQLTLWGVLFGPPAAFAVNGVGTQQAVNVVGALMGCLLLLGAVIRRGDRDPQPGGAG